MKRAAGSVAVAVLLWTVGYAAIGCGARSSLDLSACAHLCCDPPPGGRGPPSFQCVDPGVACVLPSSTCEATDAGTPSCSVPLMCSDNTRGTWRLETTSHEPAGYLFTFDGSVACNGTPDAYLLDLRVAGGECDRNGDYMIAENTAAVFQVSSDNLGGSGGGACGDPTSESQQLDLTRSGCDAVTYQLVVHDSAANSPFDAMLIATRCRCDIGWDPCVDPLPADPCAP